MEKMTVYLSEFGEWLLYRGLVCEMITKEGHLEKIDCDLWEFTESLDMSFDEIKELPIEEWPIKVKADLDEFVKDWEMRNGMMRAE
ncbi:hypothetical protein HOU20_gp65 [Citrobacter phage Sazh]|uniref:Uncharacterized protein n=1 Tax=Citrobacter phage Sazh TaxID=2315629 RepID=A0A385IQL4_9CAUD|nr:hypothetical protein HOU20_gp65 [Citrobacter phage Sazh]AXY85489.1 hypothetical protein CPT_Sazh_065 [Citrobacter phage Sazh]EHO4912767.1 hypothetical protein [Salmonella enterica subsp. enterica serovar Kedougou]